MHSLSISFFLLSPYRHFDSQIREKLQRSLCLNFSTSERTCIWKEWLESVFGWWLIILPKADICPWLSSDSKIQDFLLLESCDNICSGGIKKGSLTSIANLDDNMEIRSLNFSKICHCFSVLFSSVNVILLSLLLASWMKCFVVVKVGDRLLHFCFLFISCLYY